MLVVHARSARSIPTRGRGRHGARPPPELFATFERIARRIAPPSSKSSAELERQHPPIAVFEDFIKGLLAETPDTAIDYLSAALKAQPTFDRARLALWDIDTEQDDHEAALAAVVGVAADSPLARRARFLSGLSQLSLKKYDEAFALFKALADAQPTASVLNNLGVVQLRRVATPQTGQPVYYHESRGSRPDADLLFNPGYAYWQDHDAQAAMIGEGGSAAIRPTAMCTVLGASTLRGRGQRGRGHARASWRDAVVPHNRASAGGDASRAPEHQERCGAAAIRRVEERLASAGQRDWRSSRRSI